MTNPTPKRWFRFSLRTLMILVTLACLWLGWKTKVARDQQRAVATVEQAEGLVIFDYQEDETGARIANAEPPGPVWLRQWIGEDYFRTPVTVDFATNRGRRRGTDQPKLTHDALAAAAQFPNLYVLELSHNETVTDEALALLEPLSRLRTLYLYNTEVTGEGLSNLTGLPVEYLTLSESPVRDEGLTHLASMERLVSLSLDDTLITDEGLESLAGLSKLEDLRLRRTEVTDRGLEHLRGMQSLTSLLLGGTRVTAEGVARLQEALPNCRITVDYGLGMLPDRELLFPEGQTFTKAEIEAALAARGIGHTIDTDPAMPGNPITSLRLEESTLGSEPILQLIRMMPELRQLNVQRSLADDALLEGLAECAHLEGLYLRAGRFTDEGPRHLAAVESLREAEVYELWFSDAAVQHLAKLKQLRQIHIGESRLSDEGIEALKEALPGVRVFAN